MKTRRLLAVVAVLVAVSIAIQVQRDRGWQAYEPATPLLWMQAGPAIERATLGYDAIVSDVYWMRTVVYFGQQRLLKAQGKTYDLLYPMLDLVTTLDPHFMLAYRFGAIFLSERYPDGPHRPDLAIALLQRGIERNPARWEFLHDIAFVYYFTYRNYVAASEWFDRASRVPGAPVWLRTMSATTLTLGGEREASRLLWRELYEGTEADAIKQNALYRLAQLDVMDLIDELNPVVWRYKVHAGHFPESWNELIAAGVLRAVPTDPTGVPLVLYRRNEDVRVSRRSELWPMPEGMEIYRQ